MNKVLVVQGATGLAEVPGLETVSGTVEIRFATSADELACAMIGAEMMLGWDFKADELRAAWGASRQMRWIHWGGAGVDAVLFPELVESEVVLTNTRGVFDRAMAEFVLGLIIAFSKRFPETLDLQTKRTWRHRLTEPIENARALVVGVGSIGRETARLLSAAGLEVTGVGTRARDGDPVFGHVHSVEELEQLLPDADFVVSVVPLTERTRGLFGKQQFRAMRPSARFINVGRGPSVDEAALHAALADGAIAGAALDVFETEPLPEDSPLWSTPNLLVSPHMSGDFEGYKAVVADLFLDNLRRYLSGEPLLHVVDKVKGYVPE